MKVDSQVDLLVRPLGAISEAIADLLAKLPFAEHAERREIMQRIENLLRAADDEVRVWAEKELASAAEDHDDELKLLLLGLILEDSPRISQLVANVRAQLQSAVRSLSRQVIVMGTRLSSPVTSSSTVGGILRVSRMPPLRQSDNLSAQALLERQVRDELRRGFVTVIGRNGAAYRYAMDYYISLQAFMSRQLLLRDISVFRTNEAGFDLVQISDNPSTIGDFCDLYRGHVFSLSGTHPLYPALSSVPNGGPPLHPWCRHTLLPFMSDVADPELAAIPDAFTELGSSGRASTNDFTRLWLQYQDELDD